MQSIGSALSIVNGSNTASFYDIFSGNLIGNPTYYLTGGTTTPWLLRVAASIIVSTTQNFIKVGLGAHTGIASNLINNLYYKFTPNI